MKLLLVFMLISTANAADKIVVGSKIFTESYLLSEIAAQSIEANSSVPVDRKAGLGNTGILFESLKAGVIDVYPEYTGTIAETILKKPALKSSDEIRKALGPMGLTISSSLGFNNTYALAVKEAFAKKHSLRNLSDLRAIAPKLRAAFSYEFMERKDGFRGMVDRYGLKFDPANVKQMEHSLVYQALDEDAVDVIEVYSTDANIKKFGLITLRDDLGYFPAYEAVWVARIPFTTEHPTEWQALRAREGTLNEDKMRTLNAQADLEKVSFEKIAANLLHSKTSRDSGLSAQIVQRTKEHLWLVGISLLFSVFIGVPLGIFASRSKTAGQLVLLLSALIQTIPALALLCFLIPVFGIGLKPALVALCLYSLLPVVLNTFTGIRSIDSKHIENAKAFGLTGTQTLTHVILPMSSPMILAGIKTATIVGIGTATLAALIGAGGYGALIVSGLALNQIPTVLAGAIPAAVLALIAHFGFGLLSRVVVPRGMRL